MRFENQENVIQPGKKFDLQKRSTKLLPTVWVQGYNTWSVGVWDDMKEMTFGGCFLAVATAASQPAGFGV